VEGNIALKQPAPGSLFCASELRQDAMLLAVPAVGFATVPVAGKDCVELEHADKATEKTAIAVSRGKFNASTFHERSAMGCKDYVAWERLTSWVRCSFAYRLKGNPKTPSAALAIDNNG
jgi:hypothetical protein